MEVEGLPMAAGPPHIRDKEERQPAAEPARRHPEAASSHRLIRSSAHFIRSVATLGVAQVLSWLGGAALTVVGPRTLGDAGLGKVAFALALTSLTALVASFGTGTYLAKEIARAPSRARGLVGDAVAIRLLLSIPAVALTIGIVYTVPYDNLTRLAVVVMSGMLVLGAFEVCLSALQGLHKMQRLAIATTVLRLASVAIAVAVLLAGYGPVGFAVAWVIGESIGVAVAASLLFPQVRPSISIAPRAWIALLAAGLPFFIWQAALVVYGQIDTVLLSVMTHAEVVGWYAAAYRIILIPSFLPGILVMIIFPALSTANRLPDAFDAIARRSAHVLLMVSIPIGVGIMLLAPQLMSFLGYPREFEHSVWPILLLAPHIPLVAIDMVIGTALNALDRQRAWALTGVAAAVFNIGLNLVAIPTTQHWYGNGAVGAAAVTTLTEVFMFVVGLWLLPRPIFGTRLIADTLRFLGAAATMSVVVWLLRNLLVLVPILAGSAVYLVVCLWLGAVTLAEIREVVDEVLHRRPPAPVDEA